MSHPTKVQQWLQNKHYQFELSLAVYMMTPGEKFAFYSIFFLLCSLTFIAIILYLPHHIYFLVGRAWYYINGEHIDVGATVKEMSASMLNDASTPTTLELVDTAQALLKEL